MIETKQKLAIERLDPGKFVYNDIDNQRERGVSPYVAQYIVKTDGRDPFQDPNIDIVSDAVREAIRGVFFKKNVNMEDKILILRENDRHPDYLPSMWQDLYDLAEHVIAQLLQGRGVYWQKKSLSDSNFTGFNLKLNSIEEEKSPKFASMKPMVIYKLVKDDYPAIGMMYKTEEGWLYGLMVVSPQDGSKSIKIKTSAVDKWLDNIGFEDDREKVRIAVIPRPPLADEFEAEYEGDETGYPQLELWKVPFHS